MLSIWVRTLCALFFVIPIHYSLKKLRIFSKIFFSLLSGCGKKLDELRRVLIIFFSSEERFCGVHTFICTNKSPLSYELNSGIPLLFNRRIFPLWVPGSMPIFAFPLKVGISTEVPMQASGKPMYNS